MTVSAWRIVKHKNAGSAFSGEGAHRYGGRWNQPGTAMVYTAGSVSLAILEMLVHVRSPDLLARYAVFEVRFSTTLMQRLPLARLPKAWRRSPSRRAVQSLGDAWVVGAASAVLQVPSAVVPTEWNYLLNPAHEDFHRIDIGKPRRIEFDERLLRP